MITYILELIAVCLENYMPFKRKYVGGGNPSKLHFKKN